MSDEVLVKVEGVSRKFCRSLKRSLWYGVQHVSAEMFGRKGTLLKMLNGLVKPDKGRITMRERAVWG